MSQYRDLNKELVEQVQTMRKNMKLYCDEIVYLKGELLQKHENELFFRKKCHNWAVNNFIQLIQFVQPDSEILPVLEEHIHSGQMSSRTSTRSVPPWPERRSDARSRSSTLTREFQKSSSVINLRKSVCSTSPIRRSSAASDEEEQNSQSIPQDAEQMENAEVADNEAIQNDVPRTTNTQNIIFEESDEDEEDYNYVDMDVESVESVEEISISEEEDALTDITNILKSTNITSKTHSNQEKEAKKKAPPKKTKKKNRRGKENSSDDDKTSKEDSDIGVAKGSTKLGRTRFAEKSHDTVEEETLQEARRYSNSRRNYDISKSFALNPITNNGQTANNEVTLNSTTLVLSDMTLQNFRDAACSTPNSRQNSLEANSTTRCESVSTVQTISNTINRPSRHCKPKNLAEPLLSTKLRNESETKPKRNSRKTKSKPKT